MYKEADVLGEIGEAMERMTLEKDKVTCMALEEKEKEEEQEAEKEE